MTTQRVFRMTEAEYRELREENIGLCKLCGAERECCEPDARQYDCEDCGAAAVFGIEELLVEGLVELTPEE